jgi:iron complex outermembrane receptor protein
VSSGATVTTIQNVGRIRTRGLELAGEWRALGIAATLGQRDLRAFAHRRERRLPGQRGQQPARVPDWRATALATWRLRERLSATFGARYSGQQFNTLDNSRPERQFLHGTSHYLVYDTRLRLALGHVTASLGIDNLGNERTGRSTRTRGAPTAPSCPRGCRTAAAD